MPERAARAPVEWGVATRCRRGEATSGDLAVVTLLPEGALVAAIDGLGHGGEAARAARTAGRVVRDSPSRDLVPLVERCHAALRDTRGAAISLAFVSPSQEHDDLARRRQRRGAGAERRPVGDAAEGLARAWQRRSRARAAQREDRDARRAARRRPRPGHRRDRGRLRATRSTSPGSAQAITRPDPGRSLEGRRTTRWSWLSATSGRGRERAGGTGARPFRAAYASALADYLRAPSEPLASRRVRARPRGGEPAAERARPGRRPPGGPALGAGAERRARRRRRT